MARPGAGAGRADPYDGVTMAQGAQFRLLGFGEEEIRNDVTQVPFLGNLPILGYLFKQTGTSSKKTELLIFLTPRIVKESVNSVR